MEKTKIHQTICEELNKLYERKNHDYGDSFGKSYDEYGMAMPCIRLEDKLNRLKALTRNGNQQVADESIEDTLLDLANYAIMTVVERKKHSAIKRRYYPPTQTCDICPDFDPDRGPASPACRKCKYFHLMENAKFTEVSSND